MNKSTDYILKSPEEKVRLQLQAKTWEPETEILLDRVNVQLGWHCLDLACGAMGILGPLSRRVGKAGRVVGLDQDKELLSAARDYIGEEKLTNVELVQGNALKTNLPRDSFDLVHARLLFTHGKNEEILREMIGLTKPGGIVCIQDCDASSWNFFPQSDVWKRLKKISEQAFASGGGNLNAGQETFGMLRRAKLENVHIRAAVLALQDRHPYLRMPIVGFAALRDRIIQAGIVTADDLDADLAQLEEICQDPETSGLTLTMIQVWGRKPL